MAAALEVRKDYEAVDVRELARTSRDGNQVRRRLALAVIYEGARGVMRLELAASGCRPSGTGFAVQCRRP